MFNCICFVKYIVLLLHTYAYIVAVLVRGIYFHDMGDETKERRNDKSLTFVSYSLFLSMSSVL